MNRRLSILVACLAGTTILGTTLGCGIPGQDTPTVIDATAVPFDLLDPGHGTPTPVPTAASTAHPGVATASVFFLQNKALVPVRRTARLGPTPQRLATVIAALTSGPSAVEQAGGYATAIPPGLEVSFVSLVDGQVTVDLAGESGVVTPAESPLTVGQIVLTLTAFPGIDEVRLTRDHVSIEVPLADGSLTSAPLGADDYRLLRRDAGTVDRRR
jgi:Sporulation and spore germination